MVWVPFPKEFEKWKKFTNSDCESFSVFCDGLEPIRNSQTITCIGLSVGKMERELRDRGLENTEDGRRVCCEMIVAEM